MNTTHELVQIAKQKSRSIVYFINKQRLSRYRLLFCISSGRAGSGYLAELLNTAINTYGFHEPTPQMIGSDLNLINKFSYEKTFKKRMYKVAGIKDKLLKLPDEATYCETSHMFIKTFFDVVISEFPDQVEVIACRRYLPKVLKSFIELKYFSDSNKFWPKWMSSPNAVTAAIPCISPDKDLDQYDMAIAYLIDIEARLQRFKSAYPSIKIHEVRLEKLNDLSYLELFFDRLSIIPGPQTLALYNKPKNTREHFKKKYSGDQIVDLSYCEERIQAYINKAAEHNIKVPESLALTAID